MSMHVAHLAANPVNHSLTLADQLDIYPVLGTLIGPIRVIYGVAAAVLGALGRLCCLQKDFQAIYHIKRGIVSLVSFLPLAARTLKAWNASRGAAAEPMPEQPPIAPHSPKPHDPADPQQSILQEPQEPQELESLAQKWPPQPMDYSTQKSPPPEQEAEEAEEWVAPQSEPEQTQAAKEFDEYLESLKRLSDRLLNAQKAESQPQFQKVQVPERPTTPPRSGDTSHKSGREGSVTATSEVGRRGGRRAKY